MGPYEVVTAFDNGLVEIKKIDGSQISFVVNGHRLRLYHQPISKQDFVQNALQQKEMELVLKLFWVIFICIYVNTLLFLQINKFISNTLTTFIHDSFL